MARPQSANDRFREVEISCIQEAFGDLRQGISFDNRISPQIRRQLIEICNIREQFEVTAVRLKKSARAN